MSAHKTPRWTSDETAILREAYPTGGLKAAQESLPHRSWASIYCRANKLGLKADQTLTTGGRRCSLKGDQLAEAMRLREQKWSFARIGAQLGYAECTVSNAVIIAMSRRDGYTIAEREKNGRLTPAGHERLRWMLKKGLKGVEIQLRLGVSASTVAEQRRRYNADLASRGKALLPPPGNGERYSGVRATKEAKRQAEKLFLEGYGTAKVAAMSGVSKTVCTRIRHAIVVRLKRKGEALPGCDLKGKRHVMRDHTNHIPGELVAKFRRLVMQRTPVSRAASMCGIGTCSAYRIRDAMKAEIGDALPEPTRPGRMTPLQREMVAAQAIPAGQLYRYRTLVRECGDPEEARRIIRREIAEVEAKVVAERRAEMTRPRTFEEQMELVARGASISNKLTLSKPDHAFTLGGVSAGIGL